MRPLLSGLSCNGSGVGRPQATPGPLQLLSMSQGATPRPTSDSPLGERIRVGGRRLVLLPQDAPTLRFDDFRPQVPVIERAPESAHGTKERSGVAELDVALFDAALRPALGDVDETPAKLDDSSSVDGGASEGTSIRT